MGPLKKNLLVPKEAENKLKRNVRSGRAELKSSKVEMVRPTLSFGKNPSIANNMASEMFTYKI